MWIVAQLHPVCHRIRTRDPREPDHLSPLAVKIVADAAHVMQDSSMIPISPAIRERSARAPSPGNFAMAVVGLADRALCAHQRGLIPTMDRSAAGAQAAPRSFPAHAALRALPVVGQQRRSAEGTHR